MFSVGIIAALLSMLVAVVSTLISKRIAPQLGNRLSPILTVGFGAVTMLVGALIFGFGSLGLQDIIISGISGFFLSLGFIFRYTSLRTEQITNTVAVGQIQQAIVVIFSLFILGEALSLLQLMLIVIVFIGSTLVATTERFELNRNLIPAFFASVSWGIYWVLIAYSVNNSDNFLLSLIVSRIIGVAVLLVYLFFYRKETISRSKSIIRNNGRNIMMMLLVLGIIAGLTNGLGDALFGAVAYYKVLAVGSAINTLSPILIALLAYFIFRERLNRQQMVGFVVMIVAVMMLSVI